MNCLKSFTTALLVSFLAACGGGGGDAGTSPFGSGSTTSGCSASPAPSGSGVSGTSSTCIAAGATSVDVLTSATTVNSGGDTVKITAVVKGAGNVGLAGAAVGFSADSGNLTGASATTDSTGTATATFTTGSDRSNRAVTVTVTAGKASGKVLLDVIGTKITFNGATTIPLAGTASLPVTVVDARGTPISGQMLAVTSSLNNGLSATTVTTNALGVATVDYTATNAGADTIKFVGGGTSATSTIQISAASFAFESPAASAQVNVATSSLVTVRYLVSGAPQAGSTINFSTTAGTLSTNTAVTDATGRASVNISSATASPAVVQATVQGAAVQATVPIVFVARVPSAIIAQASPTALAPNAAGSVTQQAQVLATVRDAVGNPVSGALVSFTRVVDPSGGSLSQPSQTTDLNGQATVQYISGAIATASNGVQIRAQVVGSAVATCAAAATGCNKDAALTVNQSALFIALGTGNEIGNLDPQTYRKDYTVYVTDSNGVPVPNINLTIKALPTRYRKGRLVFDSLVGGWVYAAGVVTCVNEDANYNGVLDAGEDINGDGRLQPGNVISVTTAVSATPGSSGIAKTDASGRATITLLYAESYVPWVEIRLVAQAIVAGTESSTDTVFFPPGVAADFTSSTNPPAGTTSPFGTNGCTVPN